MADGQGQGGVGGQLSADESALLTGQVAILASAGLPLSPGLRAAAEEMPWGRLRSALNGLAGSLDTGVSLVEAVESQRDRLPPHLQGLVLAGARSGKMGELLGRFSSFAGLGSELRGAVWYSLVSAGVALFVSSAIFVFINVTLMGAFVPLFKDFGVQLPKITILMIAFSRLFDIGWPLMLEVALGVVVFGIFARLVMSEPQRRSLIGRLPIFGAVWKNASLAEFCHLFALLLESHLPIVEALKLAGEGVKDASLRHACQAMSADVAGGLTLAQAVSHRTFFPAGLARVLRWAEGVHGLPEAMHTTGEMFETRARSQAVFAGAILGALAWAMIVLTIVLEVVGILLPLYSLISALSG